MHQYQSDTVGRAFEGLGCTLCEHKARHGIGHHRRQLGIDRCRKRLAVRLIGHAQDCVGMAMGDEFMRQKSVQQGFDGRISSAAIEETGALSTTHIHPGETVQTA